MTRHENKKGLGQRRSSAVKASPEKNEQRHPAPKSFTPGLYIVATPIGNAQDITLRGLDILGQADVIACEDTRVTSKLLAVHGISRPLTAYHEHNADKAGLKLIQRLKDGEIVALVSDAGTPLVSDPGYKLIGACLKESLAVVPLPGASSVLAALIVSGLPTDRFFFAGFLPPKTSARQKALNDLAEIPGSLVFMESAKRLSASLADMAQVLGPRPAAVCRELTKMFEETRRGPLDELAAFYRSHGAPKGEVTIVAAPFAGNPISDAELDRLLGQALKRSTVRDAADAVTAATGLPRKRVYSRALGLMKNP